MFGKKKEDDIIANAGEEDLAAMEKSMLEGSSISPIANPDPDDQKTEAEIEAEAVKKAEEEKDPSQKEIERLRKEHSGSRTAFYKKDNELRAEREKGRKLRIENLKLKAGSFEPLTAEEEADLIDEDPRAFVDYELRKRDHSSASERIKTEERLIQTERDDETGNDIFANTVRYIGKMLKIPVTEENLVLSNAASLPKEIQEFGMSDKYVKVRNAVDERFTKRGLIPTADDMEAIHFQLNRDEILSTAKAGAAETLKTNINNAARNTSPLNSVPSSKEAGKSVDFEKMTPADIAGLGEDDYASYEKWANEKVAGG